MIVARESLEQKRINPYMEMRFLRILKEGKISISHLQQKANVNPKTLQKYVQYLHSKQFVDLYVDGRFKKLTITEKGMKRLDELEKVLG